MREKTSMTESFVPASSIHTGVETLTAAQLWVASMV